MDKVIQLVLKMWKSDAILQKLELLESGAITVTFFDSGGNFHEQLHKPDGTFTTIQ